MKEFITSNGGLIAVVVLAVTALNILLSGLHKFLEFIKDKTTSAVDNKADDLVVKVITVLQKILDIISANPEHK